MGKWCAHVVLVPGVGAGHSIPSFDLATRLAARDVKVTILAIETLVQRIWSEAIYRRWTPRMRAGEDIELVPVKDGVHNGTLEGFWSFIHESSEAKLIAAFSAQLAPLMSNETVPPPCCIISDMLVGWTQDVAAKFNIPRYILHSQPATDLLIMLHVPTLIAEGKLPLTEDNKTEPMEVPGIRVPVRPADLHTDLIDPQSFKWGSFDLYIRMARRANQAPIILVNTFRELEEDVFEALDGLHSSQASTYRQAPKVIPVGPLLLPADFPSLVTVAEEELSEESTRIMQWLDTQPPRSVLYIAFGTLVSNAHEQIQEIAFGLEASKQTFLWAAGSSIHEKKPAAKLLPQGFEERTREQGKVAGSVVPQLRILRHPACGSFLSHCGWNTVQESISGGVPLIAWPRQFEQRMTARFLIDTVKVAAELAEVREGFVSRDEIQRVVQQVLQGAEGEALRARAAELQKAAARYAYSNPNLDAFLAEIKPMKRHADA